MPIKNQKNASDDKCEPSKAFSRLRLSFPLTAQPLADPIIELREASVITRRKEKQASTKDGG